MPNSKGNRSEAHLILTECLEVPMRNNTFIKLAQSIPNGIFESLESRGYTKESISSVHSRSGERPLVGGVAHIMGIENSSDYG